MKGNDPAFLEAARLVRKFFPESTSCIPEEIGLDWDSFLGAMTTANYEADYPRRYNVVWHALPSSRFR